jgi:hypothetical protein
MKNSADVLKEIIHRAVTFTPSSIDVDTDALNKAISQGYLIHDSVRTETGIVYVLAKWKKPKKAISNNLEKSSLGDNSLKDCYNEFCKGKKK